MMPKSFAADPADQKFVYPSLWWLGAAVLCAALCAWLRFDLIEPLARSAQCAAGPDTLICQVRGGVITLFQGERMGWAALILAVLAALAGWRWLAGIALLAGAAALMLYSVEPGAVAALLASTVLLRSGKSE